MARRVTQIESLRVLAMFAIFVYHLWSVLPRAGTDSPLGPLLGGIMSQGYLGVVVFNAITGFVLTLPHAGPDGKPPLAYGAFLGRRFTRILPQYYLALALWTVVALVAGTMTLAALAPCLGEKLVLAQTLDPGRFFCLVPALWWMGLLAQFYLVFPLLLALYRRLGTGRAVLVCLGTGWGLWVVLSLVAKASPTAALFDYMLYFNLPYRLPEFALGMAGALAWKRRAARQVPGDLATGVPVSVLVGCLTLVYLGLPCSIAFKDALPMVLAHILLVMTCLGVAGALFCWPAMARWGRRPAVAGAAAASYGFYLLHQPLLGYLADLLRDRMSPFAAMLVCGLTVLPLAYGLALAQDRLVAAWEAGKTAKAAGR